MTISNYSTTDTENNDAVPNGAPDGMLPSDVIDVFRQLMVDQRNQWNDAQWFEYLDGSKDGTVSYSSTNTFTVSGDNASGHYHVGRRLKIEDGSGTLYTSITNVTGSNPTTIEVADNLTSPINNVYTSILSNSGDALPREAIQDIIGAMVSGNNETRITVNYDDNNDKLDFDVDAADWTDITNVPSSFTPSSHSHAESDLPDASTSAKGVVQLNNTTSSTSTTQAATANAVKTAYDLANSHTHTNYITSNASDTATGIYTFNNGADATTSTNGTLRITGGIGLSGNIVAAGDITAFYTSDRNLKSDITPISNALEKLSQLSGNSYYYKRPRTEASQNKQYGVIAQEVQSVLPEMVQKNHEGNLVLKQGGFELTALLIEAVKELSERINKLEEE